MVAEVKRALMLSNMLVQILGREFAWRLGRKLYMLARGDGPNSMAINGESELIGRLLNAFADAGTGHEFVAFDVGANVGLWTDILLQYADSLNSPVHVDLFEPAPHAFEQLRTKFANDHRVGTHRRGLSDHGGKAQMEMVGALAGTNTLSPVGAVGSLLEEVEIATFDSVRDGLGYDLVNLVKIDAEGHDLMVLRGMENSLRAGAVEVVQFEYNWRWLVSGSSMRAVFALAREHGYVVGRCDSRDLFVFDEWLDELDRFFENNYLLIRKDLVSRLGASVGRWNVHNVLVFA
jgi:FkbM family methyltransferase